MQEIKSYDNNSLVFKDGKNIIVKYTEIGTDESVNFKLKNFYSLRVAKVFAKLKNKKYNRESSVLYEQMLYDETKRKYSEYFVKKILRNSYYGYVPKMCNKEYEND